MSARRAMRSCATRRSPRSHSPVPHARARPSWLRALKRGGKSPQIVFADAPRLDDVARRIAGAISGNAGQVCVAGSRLLVERSLAEPLAERIQAVFSGLKAGATWTP